MTGGSLAEPRVRRAAHAARRWIGRPWQARATTTYLCILSATSLVLVTTTARRQQALLRAASTNLNQLGRNPLPVLVSSAFWLPPDGLASKLGVVAFAVLVMAPLELWLGTGRWLVAFVTGHVGATLLTAAGLSVAVDSGWVSRRLTRTIDVGYSYGTLCLAALLVYRLPRRWRVPAAAALVVWALAALRGGDYSSWGHLLAILIGFALWPLARRRAAVGAVSSTRLVDDESPAVT